MAANRLTNAQTWILLLVAATTACHMLTSVEASEDGQCSASSVEATYKLSPGALLISDDHTYMVVMQWDCNLVLYEPRKTIAALWSSQTNGKGVNCYATMQTDGQFAIYDGSNNFIWATDSSQTGSQTEGCVFLAIVQNDGNFVVYCTADEYSSQTTHAIWSSETSNQ